MVGKGREGLVWAGRWGRLGVGWGGWGGWG